MALLQRQCLTWDYWQLYESEGAAGGPTEPLRTPPTTFRDAEVASLADEHLWGWAVSCRMSERLPQSSKSHTKGGLVCGVRHQCAD